MPGICGGCCTGGAYVVAFFLTDCPVLASTVGLPRCCISTSWPTCGSASLAQAGKHNHKRESFGHSLIIDPWGKVVGRLQDPLATGGACFFPTNLPALCIAFAGAVCPCLSWEVCTCQSTGVKCLYLHESTCLCRSCLHTISTFPDFHGTLTCSCRHRGGGCGPGPGGGGAGKDAHRCAPSQRTCCLLPLRRRGRGVACWASHVV